jgi:hypothetical protein
MSCHSTSDRFSNSAARRNGVWSQTSRYLNTIGNWNTYRDLKSLDQIPARLGQVTQAMFGLSELSNVLQGKTPRVMTGILAATLGVQALEQVTGNVATAGVRLVGQGKPVAKYRGLIIRQSPVIERKARLLNRITGGRVTNAGGYYFHDGGRTWHAQSFTTEVKGTPRTLTQVKSLGLPYREHYFDRPLTLDRSGEQATGDDSEKRSVYVQRVIDVIKGNNDPATIPGYIGSTNELENATPLGGLKRAFFAANWFLVDESERDDPAGRSDFVDYDALVAGRSTTSQSSGYYRVAPQRNNSQSWPTTRARPINIPSSNPYRSIVQAQTSPAASQADPYQTVKERWRAADGKQYPLVIQRVVTNPISHTRKADAWYYDGQRWREIVDDTDRRILAKRVDAGELPVAGEKPT